MHVSAKLKAGPATGETKGIREGGGGYHMNKGEPEFRSKRGGGARDESWGVKGAIWILIWNHGGIDLEKGGGIKNSRKQKDDAGEERSKKKNG